MNTTLLFNQLLGMAKMSLPFLGSKAHAPIERVVTIPEKEIRKLMGNASEEDKKEAVALGRKYADAFSDFIVHVASKGQIEAD
jgi:hypothetical protein